MKILRYEAIHGIYQKIIFIYALVGAKDDDSHKADFIEVCNLNISDFNSLPVKFISWTKDYLR